MEVGRNKPRVLHVLRSVMLAGAGAIVWMALSSTAANADSGSSNHTLPGGADSAVISVVHDATAKRSGTPSNANSARVASAPAPAADSAPVPVVLPAVQAPAVVVSERPQLTQTTDQVVASTPVANVVPPGTFGAATNPVISPALGAADGAGTGVDSLLDGLVTPALGVVGSTVGVLPVDILPVTIPDIPLMISATDIPGGVGTVATPTEQTPVLAPAADTFSPDAGAPAASLLSLAAPYGLPGLGRALWSATAGSSGSGDRLAPPSGGTLPTGAPSGGDAGNGSAALTSNPSGAAAAWLPSTNLFHPLAGTPVSTAAAGRVPAPVSFDPGSSPD